ncbi:MAG: PrsW family intramembrane metalloprotease [Planctomycetota bacterium]
MVVADITPGAAALSDWIAAARVGATIMIGLLLWILYFHFKDRKNPEPKRLVLYAFVLGLVSAGIALSLFELLAWIGVPIEAAGTTAQIAIFCLVVVGPVEEGSKFIVARIGIFRSHHFDEEIDGLIYASSVALGFSAIENLLYSNGQDWTVGLARSLASPLSHSLFSAIWGFGMSHSRTRAATRSGRFAWQAGSLILAMGVHGLYDFVLLGLDAPIYAGGIVLAVWIAVLIQVRRVAGRDEKRPEQRPGLFTEI